jgi:hypothetical protein
MELSTIKNRALKIMIGLLMFIILFHFCIIIKIIPYKIAWGGRLENTKHMYIFETLSILINLFLFFILLMKGRYIESRFREKTLNIILGIFLILFVLNTVGNLFAQTAFEKLFALLTLKFAVLLWSVLRPKSKAS